MGKKFELSKDFRDTLIERAEYEINGVFAANDYVLVITQTELEEFIKEVYDEWKNDVKDGLY